MKAVLAPQEVVYEVRLVGAGSIAEFTVTVADTGTAVPLGPEHERV